MLLTILGWPVWGAVAVREATSLVFVYFAIFVFVHQRAKAFDCPHCGKGFGGERLVLGDTCAHCLIKQGTSRWRLGFERSGSAPIPRRRG